MSLYTSLDYYFPRTPPAIRAVDLARFVEAIAGLGLVEPEGRCRAQLRFGAPIDAPCPEVDDDGDDGSPGVHELRAPEWEFETAELSRLDDLANAMPRDERSVRRAFVSLGFFRSGVNDSFVRLSDDPDETNFTPDSVSVTVGPIRSRRYDSDETLLVGWLAVTISGYGLPYPWTFREVRERLEAVPEVRATMDLCRATWPVEPREPPDEIVALRREIGDLWPYDARRPYDWSWGLRES